MFEEIVKPTPIAQCEKCSKLVTRLEASLRISNTNKCVCGGELINWPPKKITSNANPYQTP